MKKYIVILCCVALLSACKEDGPFIDFSPTHVKLEGDTDYVASIVATAQLHNVLLEDITGVKCPNCPASHDAAKAISDGNPGRIVIAALHAYSNPIFTDPNPPSSGFPDFRDSTADYIVTQLLGNPNALPKGAIDRKNFEIPPAVPPLRNYDYSKWSGYANQELLVATPVNLEITNSYNATTREVTAVVKIECTQDIAGSLYLSVGITENNIIAKQKDGLNIIDNYVHNHIFRKMLTPNQGLQINSPTIILDAKKVVIRVFKYTLPAGYNAANSNVIGILNSSAIDVVQCAETKIL
jgi:hypothetical protein